MTRPETRTASSPEIGEGGLAFAFRHCEELVREGDPDRYLATLFAPAAFRPQRRAAAGPLPGNGARPFTWSDLRSARLGVSLPFD